MNLAMDWGRSRNSRRAINGMHLYVTCSGCAGKIALCPRSASQPKRAIQYRDQRVTEQNFHSMKQDEHLARLMGVPPFPRMRTGPESTCKGKLFIWMRSCCCWLQLQVDTDRLPSLATESFKRDGISATTCSGTHRIGPVNVFI